MIERIDNVTFYETVINDIHTIMRFEIEPQNSEFVAQNTYEEHKALVDNSDVCHVSLRSTGNNTLLGYMIFAGLKSVEKSIELRRLVVFEKGQGVGRRAMKFAKKVAFESWKAHRLWLDVRSHNEVGRHIYKTEGFIEEGLLRDAVLVNNEYQSVVIMSMLEDEYLSKY